MKIEQTIAPISLRRMVELRMVKMCSTRRKTVLPMTQIGREGTDLRLIRWYLR
jgi:hypothetical protein